MSKYIVLQRRVAPELGSRALETATALSARPATLSAAVLTTREVADLARDPQTQAIALAMPTRLVAPMTPKAQPEPVAPQWGIDAVGAGASQRTGSDVVVAVLDTGIARDHPAFSGVAIVEKDFSGSGNGDVVGHGTHCAGTIFGRDVGQRIGVARGVRRALIGKVLKDDGSGDSEMIFSALSWATEEGANVISMSLGFDFPGMVAGLSNDGWPVDLATSTALEAYRGNLRMFDAMMAMMRARAPFGGSPLVVAAAGNESRRTVNHKYRIAASLPAAADGVISVAALGPGTELYSVAEFSNSLPTLAAPGVEITSAAAGGGLTTMSGTSMACPHVAGVAALWWEWLQRSAGRADARGVTARLLANARKDVLAADLDASDVGEGLVTAPA